MKSDFESLPRRIFLDTNVLQYLNDFGEFIFDHYQENEKYLISPEGRKILKGISLYQEIKALRFLLLGINRTNIEFAISESTFKEVQAKKDDGYTKWFFDVWDYWQSILQEQGDEIPSTSAKLRLEEFDNDNSILGRLSKSDKKIIRDAIFFDSNAILTTDKFKSIDKDINGKYGLRVLSPNDLWELLKPWQALWY